MSIPFSVNLEIGGHEIDVSGTYSPGDPGMTSGPPETCYPPEAPEIEITEARLRFGPKAHQTLDIIDLLQEMDEDKLYDRVHDALERAGTFDNEGPSDD